MTRFHGTIVPRSEDAAGWRNIAGGALAWLVYAPTSEPPADAWLRSLPAPWPEEPRALLEHFGAAARGVRIATGAAAAWSGESIDVAWAGDVRALLVRRGRMVATTIDHSLARTMRIPDSRLARITNRYLGDGVSPERARWNTRPGDVLLLCSPHLHDFRPEKAWLAKALNPVAALPGRLLVRAEEPGDNV